MDVLGGPIFLWFFPASEIIVSTLLQTGSALARTNLSPYGRCTLGLNRHFLKNILCVTACITQGFNYIQTILTNREMVNFKKLDFLRFLTTNFVTTGARELNGTSQLLLATSAGRYYRDTGISRYFISVIRIVIQLAISRYFQVYL